MDTDGGSTRARPADTPRPAARPQMSAAEKCMAEWEARHDVAARGHRGDPEALQHYLARSRLGEPVRPQHAAGPAAPAGDRRPLGPDPLAPEEPGTRPGSLLSRLFRRSG